MSPYAGPDLTLEGLVHDLNNVFETIAEVADLLAEDDPRHAKLAARLNRCVGRGSRILDSFFEHSQASLDFETILDSAIEFTHDFMHAVRGPEIEFLRDCEPGLKLRGNPVAWERVFMNLFLNAAQAMDASGKVEITAARTPSAIDIKVADNGPGISPKVMPRIFEPRVSTRARRSGLGLHIVQTIVQQNGGEVSASNCPSGQGAMFHIVLPNA